MRKESCERWWAGKSAIEKLDRVLSNFDERNGVSIGVRSFRKVYKRDDFYFADMKFDNPKRPRMTLICYSWVDGGKRYRWREKDNRSADRLDVFLNEKAAEYLLRYGRFEKDAGVFYGEL